MAIPVIMPRQGQSVESCMITSWLKKKGDVVFTGEILFSYETDKAAFEMESPADGTLIDIFFDDGAEVPVLTNVAAIGKPGENIDSLRPGRGEKTGIPENNPGGLIKPGGPITTTAVEGDTVRRVKISPRARKIAGEKGIDTGRIIGSGPRGRIMAGDIEKIVNRELIQTSSLQSTATRTGIGTEFTDKPLTNIRKLISRAMHSSLQNSAQLTHHMSADVRKLLRARQEIKQAVASGKSMLDITLNDMICFCVIRALGKFPEMNSHFMGESIRIFTGVNLGIAVDTPRGLMVPSVRNAESLDLASLSGELAKTAESCRKGNIDPGLLQSDAASFTVSNLGNYGVEMFTPVINLPQVGILGVCTITYRPADLGDGTIGMIPVMGLSLTYDHRAVDGGPATMFLKEIKKLIEEFNILK